MKPEITRLAIDELVADSPDPVATRAKSEAWVADGKCYCCGGSDAISDDDPIQRCYICEGRGHGDEVMDR